MPEVPGETKGDKGDNLGPPAMMRRKRGLSLRSQLFNKAFNMETANANPKSDQIELSKLGSKEEPPVNNGADPSQSNNNQNSGHFQDTDSVNNISHVTPNFSNPIEQGVPQIFVEGIDDSTIKEPSSAYIPYLHTARSDTMLTVESSTRSIEEDFPSKSWHIKKPTTKFEQLKKWKNSIFGFKNRGKTFNGRAIPISCNKNDVNSAFNHRYYDSNTKEYIDERVDVPYVNNAITSSKYSIYSFLPKQIKAQFSKIANCYFMVVAIMQMIPGWSTTGKFTTIVPLLIFMSISIAREGFDDWKRHLNDKEENNKYATVLEHSKNSSMNSSVNGSQLDLPSLSDYTQNGALERAGIEVKRRKWKHLKVGDIIQVNEDEWFPCDIVLLASSLESQDCYVETMALDGETNMKTKGPHPQLATIYSQPSGLRDKKILLTVEDPNIDLYNFEGSFELDDEIFSLGPDHIVYRGSILRNTKSVLGVVVFTGEETKIRMNNIKNPRVKAPKLQKNINYIVIFMVFVVVCLAAFSTMAQRLYLNEYRQKAWYLYGQDAGVASTLMGFIIMYNTLIPLSLYVTMEIIKLMQLMFLQYDIDMYHIESNTPADAKTATILEELGQVSYVFSDKTGTLTDNKMIFRKFSVCGVSWLHDLDVQLSSSTISREPSPERKSHSYYENTTTTQLVRQSMDIDAPKLSTSWRSTANPSKCQDSNPSLELLKYIQTHPQTLFAKKARFFLLSIALCNTAVPKKVKSKCFNNSGSSRSSSQISFASEDEVEDQNITYQAASPDEIALVQAARDLGFVVIDRKHQKLYLKLYPQGFDNQPQIEEYQVLDIVEFSSVRKRMSIVVKFPDGRICLLCKGADNVIIDHLKRKDLALEKLRDISSASQARKTAEADNVIQTRISEDIAAIQRQSLSSIRRSFSNDNFETRMNSIDNYLMGGNDSEVDNIADQARQDLKRAQSKKYSLQDKAFPPDKLLVNDEFLIEKTLFHIEEYSSEGLRTLLYGFKWLDKETYDNWSKEYSAAKVALNDRAKQVETIGGKIEHNLELIGATAIEDKLQEGVSEAIEKLRRAGIKMWMLTGDKRETAVNIGYSCRLIKDYSTVVILSIEEGRDSLMQRITSAGLEIQAGRVAHCVVVIDGATLTDIESDSALMSLFVEFCVDVDSAVVCRASPSQKANMVSKVRQLKPQCVTLAIGDGANDIAMIQSADIGVGITGKEGLQAARSSDYAIAQFRYLLKLLLVHGRYNYIRTSKFVLCTFYKELLFYLTQCIYQRHTLFSGSSMYESWSLSMFNTLFTSLPVLVIGMFDKDLHPSTLLAVPELYAKGRLYKAFNLKVFVWWMILAASQSVFLTFMMVQIWGKDALRDNTTLPLGTLSFAALVIVINAKCELIEMQNRQWLAFAAFIIEVGGYGLWNVLIMGLYRTKDSTIFYVAHGLQEFGEDQGWWAALLVLPTVLLLIDILLKVFKFMFKPSDDEVFKVYEQDIEMRRLFEEKAYEELKQGWLLPKQQSTVKMFFVNKFRKIFNLSHIDDNISDDELQRSAMQRKRAGTLIGPNEIAPGAEGESVFNSADYLPSGKRVRKNSWWQKNKDDDDIDELIARRIGGKDNTEEV